MWGSHARNVLHSKKNCPLYKSHTLRTKNIALQPLVDPHKALLPPLYIKLGLMKNSVKTLDRNGTAFSFMCEKFPRHSVEKIKASVFIGPQIYQLFRDLQSDFAPSDDEKAARNAFGHVATDFLGNVKAITRQLWDTCGRKFAASCHQDAFPPFTLGFLSC
jgi:hypothetical protein